jgi:hypothetical protein
MPIHDGSIRLAKTLKLMRRQLSRIVEIKLENNNKKRIHVHVNPF